MRYLHAQIQKTIHDEKKMAFIAGPRQVGKTTLSKKLLEEVSSENGYFNWDIDTNRRLILKEPIDFWKTVGVQTPSRIVLDEIHKYPRWKRFLKGFFDKNGEDLEIIVTGSGRLDLYQKGGDSLLGRYYLYHLHPYSVGELIHSSSTSFSPQETVLRIFENSKSDSKEAFQNLWKFNGFPEPLFRGDQKFLTRWKNSHHQLILREDLRDLTRIREIGLIESLVHLLPERIGSPLSLNSLREDINVNFLTVQNWIQALEKLYYLFSLKPYSAKLARTLSRQEKIYFYDWSELEEESKRFENLVAVHLLKACNYWTDVGDGNFQLYYVRDKEKREVDFLITEQHRPYLLVECKLSGAEISKELLYFHERLKPKFSFQVVKNLPQKIIKKEAKVAICSAERFLAEFP